MSRNIFLSYPRWSRHVSRYISGNTQFGKMADCKLPFASVWALRTNTERAPSHQSQSFDQWESCKTLTLVTRVTSFCKNLDLATRVWCEGLKNMADNVVPTRVAKSSFFTKPSHSSHQSQQIDQWESCKTRSWLWWLGFAAFSLVNSWP